MDAMIYVALGAIVALTSVVIVMRLTGFIAQTPEDYQNLGPDFDIREHLNGPIACEGIIYGPLGRISSRFVAEFNASWDGNSGRMTEHFVYDDGSIQDREWQLTLNEGGVITATADDLEGAGIGRQSGPTVLLRYNIRLPASSGGHVLNTVDWMYLMPNGTIMNRSQFRKFGIKVGELVATMRSMETS